ncbi:hypothetical protein P0082_05485 [Candidatus Haliotispira prima]|uniref:Uncharacterized protein n=1 Tax=Candidatus Haliotispira prima TaxID=3034016 RepID=A0ABY8MMA3_9SPIO|nr:hypothetical protein P0082_05485 [Candidatus Haliotispira prima]
MSHDRALPALEDIIYSLEDLDSESSQNNQDSLWLDIQSGELREIAPEQLEAKPELFGSTVFPLPPWSSEQGYGLMLEFAQGCLPPGSDNELLKILRSRHRVFRRYRRYIKENTELKQSWDSFKKGYFYRYLCSWYSREFPQARELSDLWPKIEPVPSRPTAQQKQNRLPNECPEIGLSECLLHEDFSLNKTISETEQQFLRLNEEQKECRARTLLQYTLACSPKTVVSQSALQTPQALQTDETKKVGTPKHPVPHFEKLQGFYDSLTWLNRLAAMSPTGETVAVLYWTWQTWQGPSGTQPTCQARLVEVICEENYSDLNLENHLFRYFLDKMCPELEIHTVELYLRPETEHRFAETLPGYPQEDVARICKITVQ